MPFSEKRKHNVDRRKSVTEKAHVGLTEGNSTIRGQEFVATGGLISP